MSRRKKLNAQEITNNVIKNAVNTMIKYISIISIFVSLALIAMLYLGPEIDLATGIVIRLAVPSVVLAVSITIIYELWVKNGRRNAYEEKEYQELLELYGNKSENLHYPTAQEFLDYELERRYLVEQDRIARKIHRETEFLHKIEYGIELKKTLKKKLSIKDWWEYHTVKQNIRILNKALNTIKIVMPYEKSEEFDYLRYNIQDIIYKEYSPNDTKKHLNNARRKKYIYTYTFTLGGLNILSIGGSMGNVWIAIIMTSLAAVALLYSVAQGFSVGYHNIKVISTGVYKTANSFLDQAVAYCRKTNKDLYYKGPTEFRTSRVDNIISVVQVNPVMVEKEVDIFTKAAREVTQS